MRGLPSESLLREITLLLTDVDGILTDGRIHFDADGREVKSFHVHDGAGIVYWHRAGGKSGFISGRGTEVVEARGRELGVHELHLGRLDKGPVLDGILERHALEPEQVAYLGDDLADLPVLRRVGFAVTVPQARPEVREVAHHVTDADAGTGVVREVVEILLKARGQWDDVVRKGGLP